jgi:hypothetical protein
MTAVWSQRSRRIVQAAIVRVNFRVARDSLVEGAAGEMAILRQQTTSSPFQDAIVKSCLASTNLRRLFQAVIAGRETR